MSGASGACKIWTRFELKKADGSIMKLRIEDRPVEPENDVYEFLMEHFVTEEAVHKASGVSKNEEAVKEYRELMTLFFKAVPIHAVVCCIDDDSNTAGKILGLTVIQLMRNTDKFEDIIKDMEFKTEEMQRLLYAAKVMEDYTEDLKKYEYFYYGRGIIVHPDYRRLGMAVQLVRVRELICIDTGIPMTCAWMSAKGSQKAADQNNWKTMSEVPREEMEERTGFTFDKNLPSFKFIAKIPVLMSEKGDSCKIWARFVSKRKDGSVVKLRIQDFSPDRNDDAVQFLVNNFMREEAFLVAAGVYKSEEAIQEYRELMKNILKGPNMSLVMCCIDDQNSVGHMIGLSFMGLDKNTEKLKDKVQHLELKTEEMKKFFHILTVLDDHTDEIAFETYYGGRGIAVHTDFRGLGLATEFIRVRKLICIDHKVPMTSAWMTALGTQKAAETHNWKTFFEISLEELEKITGVWFEKKLPSFKLMYTTLD